MLVLYAEESIEGSLASAVNEIDLWSVIWDMGLWRSSRCSLSRLSVHTAEAGRVHRSVLTAAVGGGGLACPEQVGVATEN